MSESEHKKYSASSSSRWLTCTASIAEEAKHEDEPSLAKDEGTVAHFLLQCALTPGSLYPTPEDAEGLYFRVAKDPVTGTTKVVGCTPKDTLAVLVDQQMIDSVNMASNYIVDLMTKMPEGTNGQAEVKLSASEIDKEFGGTADFLILPKLMSEYIVVIDFKYGKGKFVEVTDNSQLIEYGLCAWIVMGKRKYAGVKVIIIQPRCEREGDEVIRDVSLTAYELMAWERKFKAAIEQEKTNPQYVVSAECDWCMGKKMMTCPAIPQAAADAVGLKVLVDPIRRLPSPEEMSDEEISTLIVNAEVLDLWLSSVRAFAQRKAVNGAKYPNLKLVRGRPGNRKWADPVKARELLGMVYDEDDFIKEELRSPTEIEKLLGKDAIKNLNDLIVQSEGKLSLVPEVSHLTKAKQAIKSNSAEGFTDCTVIDTVLDTSISKE